MSTINARLTGGAAVIIAGIFVAFPAFAQNASQEVMKQCGDKWQAAKSANTTGNQTWPQFLSKCRTESAQKPATPAVTPAAAAAPAAAPAAGAKPAPAAAAPAAPTAPPASAAQAAPPKPAVPAAPAAAAKPAAASNAVFPSKIDAKYAAEKPGQQRQKTCLDQYNANKAANNGGNGGLNWIQKGGGYYSECNKRLGGGSGA